MDGVLQSVGENRGEVHVRKRQLFRKLYGMAELDALFLDLGFIGGKDHIDDLIFTELLPGGLIGQIHDLFDVFLGFLGLVRLGESIAQKLVWLRLRRLV